MILMMNPMANYNLQAEKPSNLQADKRKNIKVISLKMPLYGFMYDYIQAEIESANSMNVDAVLLDIDSPGGQSYECAETAEAIRKCNKPTVAYVAGEASSAAYWIASACNKIVSHRTGFVGSIGTYCYVQGDAPNSKTIVSTLSPDKVPDIENDESVRKIVEHMNSMTMDFVNDIASYRNTTPDNILSNWGKGDVIKAERALDLGMIDEIGNYNSALILCQSLASKKIGGITMKKSFYAVRGKALQPHAEAIESDEITVDFLKEMMPEIVEEIKEAAMKEYEEKAMEKEEIASMADESDEDEKTMAVSFRKGEIDEKEFTKKILARRKDRISGQAAKRAEMMSQVESGIEAGLVGGTAMKPAQNSGVRAELMKLRKVRG
jgi:ClpP class serine protease